MEKNVREKASMYVKNLNGHQFIGGVCVHCDRDVSESSERCELPKNQKIYRCTRKLTVIIF